MTGGDRFAGELIDPRLAFAVQWAPHGGGSAEEIAERFRLSVPDFYRQVLDALDTDTGTGGRLPATVADRVAAVARRRLWLGQ